MMNILSGIKLTQNKLIYHFVLSFVIYFVFYKKFMRQLTS
jgi:hypothetical protein